MRDFTHKIYMELLKALKERRFQFLTVSEYYEEKYNRDEPLILIRHDVDRKPQNSLRMAGLEYRMGVKSTYYFRTVFSTFKPRTIKKIANLGHEIGYHYESLAEKDGDNREAIKDFKLNLEKLREYYPIKTVAMHGRPTSKWDSRLMWELYDYRTYGINIEPYLDIDFKKVLYITDASRKWNNESTNLRDRVESGFNFKFTHTNDIINAIRKGELPNQIMINIHPEHWAKGVIEWYWILLIRNTKNYVKKRIIK